MKNLKETSKELNNDIVNNNEWLNREISFIIDGSYDNYYFNQMILNSYTPTKPNRGKRNINLIARTGIELISKAYNCNFNQAISVFKYLPLESQAIINNDIKDNLDSYLEMMGA